MTMQTDVHMMNPDRRQLLNTAAMGAVAASLCGFLPLHPAQAAAKLPKRRCVVS